MLRPKQWTSAHLTTSRCDRLGVWVLHVTDGSG
jgi:hypothetical protein